MCYCSRSHCTVDNPCWRSTVGLTDNIGCHGNVPKTNLSSFICCCLQTLPNWWRQTGLAEVGIIRHTKRSLAQHFISPASSRSSGTGTLPQTRVLSVASDNQTERLNRGDGQRDGQTSGRCFMLYARTSHRNKWVNGARSTTTVYRVYIWIYITNSICV